MNFTSNELARITDDFQELANDCYDNGDPDVIWGLAKFRSEQIRFLVELALHYRLQSTVPISRDEKFEWLALHGESAAPLVCDYAIGADELARRMGRFLWDGLWDGLDTLSGLDIEALTKVNCLLRVIRGSEVLPESTNQRSD